MSDDRRRSEEPATPRRLKWVKRPSCAVTLAAVSGVLAVVAALLSVFLNVAKVNYSGMLRPARPNYLVKYAEGRYYDGQFGEAVSFFKQAELEIEAEIASVSVSDEYSYELRQDLRRQLEDVRIERKVAELVVRLKGLNSSKNATVADQESILDARGAR